MSERIEGALFNFVGVVSFATIVLVGMLVGKSCFRPDPAPDAVQHAAQRAANAIAVVERTDSALRQAERHLHRAVSPRQEAAAGKAEIAILKQDTTASEAIVAAQDRVIAAQDQVIAQQDSALAAVLPATQTARDTLATYRTPIIPATPSRPKLSLGSITQYVGPSLGYGAVLTDGEVQTGPTVLLGVHVTRGVVGVSAGYGATLVGGKLHTGVAVNVGIRVTR